MRMILFTTVIGLAGLACSGGAREAIEERVRKQLAEVLHVEVESVSCPECADAARGCSCQSKIRGDEPFTVHVQGSDKDDLVLKPQGHRKFEYQVAKGFRDQLRRSVEAIACPRDGDVSAGFVCQVTVAGGEIVPVRISAAPQPDRFIWEAADLLMPAKIERYVQAQLAEQGQQVEVDCGSELRKREPGKVFECAIRNGKGTAGVVQIRVADTAGNVKILYPRPGKSP